MLYVKHTKLILESFSWKKKYRDKQLKIDFMYLSCKKQTGMLLHSTHCCYYYFLFYYSSLESVQLYVILRFFQTSMENGCYIILFAYCYLQTRYTPEYLTMEIYERASHVPINILLSSYFASNFYIFASYFPPLFFTHFWLRAFIKGRSYTTHNAKNTYLMLL